MAKFMHKNTQYFVFSIFIHYYFCFYKSSLKLNIIKSYLTGNLSTDLKTQTPANFAIEKFY